MKFKSLLTVLTLIIMSFFAFVASGGLSFSGGGARTSYGSIDVSIRIVGISAKIDAYVNIGITNAPAQYGSLTAMCRNNGGNLAPGQGDVNLDVDILGVSLTTYSNGSTTVDFAVDLVADNYISKRDANCPNGNWTVDSVEGPVLLTLEAYVDKGPSGPSNHDELADTLVYLCNYSDSQQTLDCTEQ